MARQQLIRSLIGGPILAWIAGGPVFEYVNRFMPGGAPPRLRWLLAAYVLLWPAVMLLQTRETLRALRLSPSTSTGYRITRRSILNGDRVLVAWKNAMAYRPVIIDGAERLQFVHRRGLHKTAFLPSDTLKAAAVRAEIAQHVPLYDPATHGSIDDEPTLPTWVAASGVLTMLGATAVVYLLSAPLWHWASRLDRDARANVLMAAIFLLPTVTWSTWYLFVRRGFNAIQRSRILAFAFAGGLTLWLVAPVFILTQQVKSSLDYLKTVPADVRERTARTVLPHGRHG